MPSDNLGHEMKLMFRQQSLETGGIHSTPRPVMPFDHDVPGGLQQLRIGPEKLEFRALDIEFDQVVRRGKLREKIRFTNDRNLVVLAFLRVQFRQRRRHVRTLDKRARFAAFRKEAMDKVKTLRCSVQFGETRRGGARTAITIGEQRGKSGGIPARSRRIIT